MYRRTYYRRLLLLAAVVVVCVYHFYSRSAVSPIGDFPSGVQKASPLEQPQRPSRGGVPRRPRKNRSVRPPRGGSGGVGGAEGFPSGAARGDSGSVPDGIEGRPIEGRHSELETGGEVGKPPNAEQPRLRDHDEPEAPFL